MRVLVVSDIHGNLAAFKAALREPHDALVCLGDTVGYGPEPGACVRLVRERATLAIKGNHDHALVSGADPGCRANFRWLADATAPLARIQVAPGEMSYLGHLPDSVIQSFDGIRYLFVHATPSDHLHRYLGPDEAGWLEELKQVEADVVVTGHTHLQFLLTLQGKRVLNPGSVGQPKDGDCRAAYALLQDGAVTLSRARYDIEQTVAALERSACSADAVRVLSTLLRSAQSPP
jgi:putative phosphoesterase